MRGGGIWGNGMLGRAGGGEGGEEEKGEWVGGEGRWWTRKNKEKL